jgi:hypothetical protein
MALRAVGHARVDLVGCRCANSQQKKYLLDGPKYTRVLTCESWHSRFQRNIIHLAADATVILHLRDCHTFFMDELKKGQHGYKGELTNFHAHRALRLPGNGTSTLEAQEPTADGHIEWREVTRHKRYWTLDAAHRYTDPNKYAQRILKSALLIDPCIRSKSQRFLFNFPQKNSDIFFKKFTTSVYV